jgi:glycosyltransferase involved in cell wall biosynthesis
MKSILTVHNRYRQPGGEDGAFAQEAALLERHGHTVVRYEDSNVRIGSPIAAGLGGIWNHGSYRRLRALVRTHRPDVAHVHNTFPLISPAAYYALRAEGVPIVQTVHNFRLLCAGATLQRNGTVCEDCIHHRSGASAVAHACYRESRPATAALVTMIQVHRAAGTWRRMVDLYIAPSAFVRHKLIEGGLPADRLAVKPNFVSSDRSPVDGNGEYALFVGRLAEEKGLRVLAEAWQRSPDIPLLIAGDGPLRDLSWPRRVTLLGDQSQERVIDLMRNASILIVPSTCYETGPLTVLEAFACGLPVVGSDLGSIAERIDHGQTGLLFRPGDSEDLARQVRWAFEHPEELRKMRSAARREYEAKYTPERNYRMLMEIYELAVENSKRRQPKAS